MTNEKPRLIAVVVDAGLLPENMRHEEKRPPITPMGLPQVFRKEGWIRLSWQINEGGEVVEKDRTILVTQERALQAMTALARSELVC